MRSITIHSIEPELNDRLNTLAKAKGTSKNQLIKEILAQSVGTSGTDDRRNEYHQFCGLWNTEEYKEFNATQESNSRVDPGDWK